MFSPGQSSIALAEVLDKVSQAQIANYYLGITKIPCLIKSPVREDVHPSVGIYAADNNRIKFIDFSTHETGDIIYLLSQVWNISYKDALNKIYKDISNLSGKDKVAFNRKKKNITISNKSDIDIQVKIREWRDYDIEYWKSYGITLEWLKYAEVYPISNKIMTKDGQTYIFGTEKYAYVFLEHKDNIMTFKIYQPYSKTFKWCTKTNSSVWSLWTKIPKTGKTLIISSSLKDCLNLWCNLHIPAICMQGEGYLPKPQVIEELKSRFENIIVFYDNDFKNPDNPGRADSLRLCKTYGLKRVEIPEKYGCKDPSDLYLKFGKDTYMSIMKTIFNKIESYEQEDCKH